MKLQSILLLVASSSAIVIREEPRDLPRCSTDPTVDDGHFRQDGLKVHPNYKDLKIDTDVGFYDGPNRENSGPNGEKPNCSDKAIGDK